MRLKVLAEEVHRSVQRRWRNAVANARFPQAGQVAIQPLVLQRLLKPERFSGWDHIVRITMPQQQRTIGQTR